MCCCDGGDRGGAMCNIHLKLAGVKVLVSPGQIIGDYYKYHLAFSFPMIRGTTVLHLNEPTFGSCCPSCMGWVWRYYCIFWIFVRLDQQKSLCCRLFLSVTVTGARNNRYLRSTDSLHSYPIQSNQDV